MPSRPVDKNVFDVVSRRSGKALKRAKYLENKRTVVIPYYDSSNFPYYDTHHSPGEICIGDSLEPFTGTIVKTIWAYIGTEWVELGKGDVSLWARVQGEWMEFAQNEGTHIKSIFGFVVNHDNGLSAWEELLWTTEGDGGTGYPVFPADIVFESYESPDYALSSVFGIESDGASGISRHTSIDNADTLYNNDWYVDNWSRDRTKLFLIRRFELYSDDDPSVYSFQVWQSDIDGTNREIIADLVGASVSGSEQFFSSTNNNEFVELPDGSFKVARIYQNATEATGGSPAFSNPQSLYMYDVTTETHTEILSPADFDISFRFYDFVLSAFSEDATKLAFWRGGGGGGGGGGSGNTAFVCDIDGSNLTSIDLPDVVYAVALFWNPDNSGQLLYLSEDGITQTFADGSSGSTLYAVGSDNITGQVYFSPDGTKIAFIKYHISTSTSFLHIINSSDGSDVDSLDLGFDYAATPSWSPDGDYIVILFRNADNINTLSVVTVADMSIEEIYPGDVIKYGNRVVWARAQRFA